MGRSGRPRSRAHRAGDAALTPAGARAPAPLFAALGDPHRLRIVRHLSSRGPQSITRLTEGSGISRQAMSKHVAILERAGVVHSERSGRERLLELESRRLEAARALLADVAASWDRRLGRLAQLIEARTTARQG